MKVCDNWVDGSCLPSTRGLEDNKSNNQLNEWIDGGRGLSDKFGDDDGNDDDAQGGGWGDSREDKRAGGGATMTGENISQQGEGINKNLLLHPSYNVLTVLFAEG